MATQADRLLNELKKRTQGMSTLEIRAELDIPHPAGRVSDLIKRGYTIQTRIVHEKGHKKLARYFLLE